MSCRGASRRVASYRIVLWRGMVCVVRVLWRVELGCGVLRYGVVCGCGAARFAACSDATRRGAVCCGAAGGALWRGVAWRGGARDVARLVEQKCGVLCDDVT